MRETIIYWANVIKDDLKIFRNIDFTIDYFCELQESLVIAELEGRKGVMICLIQHDWQGIRNCAELLFYIKPEYRGNISNFKKLLQALDSAAKANCCEYTTIGADIGYRDDKLLNLLIKVGYKKDTLRKAVNYG